MSENLELKQLLEAKAFLMNNDKYRFYTPIGKSETYINQLFSGNYFIGLFSAANGIGKTRLGVVIMAELIWPSGSKWFNFDLIKNWPYPKKIRVVSEPSTIKDTIIPEMFDQFPKGRYEVDKEGKNYEYKWRTDTGWEITLMTYDQHIKEFESATVGFIWNDEPPPQMIYKANISRLRRGGLFMITATPLTGSAWMYDEILANPDREKKKIFVVEANVEDACKTHGVRGFLEHAHIKQMVAQYDKEDIQARVLGKFQHLTGLVYKMWNREVHVVKARDLNPKDYSVICMLDNHPRNPTAVGWYAFDRHGHVFVVDELFVNEDIDTLVSSIRKKEENLRVEARFIDPSSYIEDQYTGESLYSRLYKRGLIFEQASKRRMEGVSLTKNALNYEIKGGIFVRTPQMFVFENCTRHIWEFEHWQWDEWRGRSAENKSPKEKPVDKDDHMMENVGRVFLSGAKFVEQRTEEYYSALSDDLDLDPYRK